MTDYKALIQEAKILNNENKSSKFRIDELNEFVEWTATIENIAQHVCFLAGDKKALANKSLVLRQDNSFMANFLTMALLAKSLDLVYKPKIEELINPIKQQLSNGTLQQELRKQLISANFLMGWAELASLSKNSMDKFCNLSNKLNNEIKQLPQEVSEALLNEYGVQFCLEQLNASMEKLYEAIQQFLNLIILNNRDQFFRERNIQFEFRYANVSKALIEFVKLSALT